LHKKLSVDSAILNTGLSEEKKLKDKNLCFRFESEFGREFIRYLLKLSS
jgi:hypothetical protein